MFFGGNGDTALAGFKFEQSDNTADHKLCGNRPANQKRKFGCANCKVLLDLHNIKFVFTSFCLHRKRIVCPFLINSNIDFIYLNLAHFRDGSTKVVLKRIASYSAKNVHQTIVSAASSPNTPSTILARWKNC